MKKIFCGFVIFLAVIFAAGEIGAKTLKVVVEDKGDYFLFYSPAIMQILEQQDKDPIVIIFCHGGFGPTNKGHPEAKFLARQGYVVAAVKYAVAKSLQEDLEAIRRARDDFEGLKIIIMGVSRGGFLALQSFLVDNIYYAGAIIVAGPTDVSSWKSSMGSPLSIKKYFASGMDPVANIDFIKKPMFLIYGTCDSAVPASQGKLLFEANEELFDLLLIAAEHGQVSGASIRFVGPWIEGILQPQEDVEEQE